jgi:hypothetical protein
MLGHLIVDIDFRTALGDTHGPLPEFELVQMHLCGFRVVASLEFLEGLGVVVDAGPGNSESGKGQVEKAECRVES